MVGKLLMSLIHKDNIFVRQDILQFFSGVSTDYKYAKSPNINKAITMNFNWLDQYRFRLLIVFEIAWIQSSFPHNQIMATFQTDLKSYRNVFQISSHKTQ